MDLIPVSFDFFGEFWIPKNLTVAELRTTLGRTTATAQIEHLYVGAVALDDHHRVGQAPVISGAYLSSTRQAPEPDSFGSSPWRVAHLTTGEVLPLSASLPGLETRVSNGKVRVKLRPGWRTPDKARVRVWVPGQVIRAQRMSTKPGSAADIVSYQLRGPAAHKPSLLTRLRHIPAARWIPAAMSMAMAMGIALMLNRPWIMLMGLSFPLVILATALGAQPGAAGAKTMSGPKDVRDSPEPAYAIGSAAVRFAGPHPCDLVDQIQGPLAESGSKLPIIAVLGPRELALGFARAVILGRASTSLPCEPVPKHGFGTRLDEPWMRWLPAGDVWAHSVLILEPGDPVPSWCSVKAIVDGGFVTWRSEAAVVAHTSYYGVTATRAEYLARLIAGNSAASATGAQLPDCVALPEAHQSSELPEPLRPHFGFQAPPPQNLDAGLPVELGIGADGLPLAFDLVADGPHALVAGTTGAGKSELLQTLVLALAARYSPDHVAIALVDYKGGAGFSHCSKLPHVVGMVTDLDPGSARRAIVGLRQQLKTRELLFDRHGVTSFPQFHQATGGQQILPRVVIVVDELRALLDEEPGFIPDLMTLAAQGRSLGIHLVLATQRPSGVITAHMRANLNARLCLRVATPQDSVEVLESGVAAHLCHQLAGRAYLKVGGSAPVALQTYYAGILPELPKVLRALQDPVTRELVPPVTLESPEPLLTRVTRITGLWRAAAAPAPLWAPELPSHYVFENAHLHGPDFVPTLTGNLLVPLGMGETQSSQTQSIAQVNLSPTDPLGGNLGIIGPSRSGHSTALGTLIQGTLLQGPLLQGTLLSPEPNLAVHGIFTDNVLAKHPDGTDLDRSLHLGTIAAHHEVRRITALFQMLQSSISPRPSILFLDDLVRLRTALESHSQGRGWDVLLDLFRRSAQLNLTIVFTSSTGIPTILGPFVSQTLVFLTGKSSDDQFFGIPRTWAGSGRLPGRGVLLTGEAPKLVQVAAGYGSDFRPAIDLCAAESVRDAALAVRIPNLPTLFTAPHTILGTTISSLLGANQPGELEEVLVPLTGSWMLAGTPRSGRTTTGQRFARAHLHAGTLLGAFGAQPTDLFQPFEALDDFLAALGAQTEVAAHAEVTDARQQGPCTVVLDDVDELYARHPQLVQRVVDTVLQHRHFLVVSALTSSLNQPRALPLALTQFNQGITLMPTARSDFQFLGHVIDHHADPAHLMPTGRIAGRGVLVRLGRARPIQVARGTWDQDEG